MNRPHSQETLTIFQNPLFWISLFIAVLAISAIADAAPASKQTKPASTIQFAETDFNFGKVQSGDLVKHEFVFTNTGNATLEISAVQPGCGCTTAGTWDKRVEPGKKGVVPLQFNSANFGGDVSKEAIVTCNDPATPKITLHLKGKVWKALEINPPMVVFNVSSETDPQQTQIVRIVNQLSDAISIWDVQCRVDGFNMELSTNVAGKEYQLKITANPPFKHGTIMAPITLKTTVKNMETINVAAYTVYQPAVQINPSQINLPEAQLGSRMSLGVFIRSSWSNALVLSEAKVNVDGVIAQIHEVSPGKVFQVSTTFEPGFQKPADKEMELEIKSNHPQFTSIKVPIYQPQLGGPGTLKAALEKKESATAPAATAVQ